MHNSSISKSSRMSGKHHSVSSPDLSVRGARTSGSMLNKSSSSRGLTRATNESGAASFLLEISSAGHLSGNLSKSNVSIGANTSRRTKLPLSAKLRKVQSSSQLSDRFMLQRLSGSQASLQSYLLTHGEPQIPGIDDDSPRTQENKRMLSRAIINSAAAGSDAVANRSQNACVSGVAGRRDASLNITNYNRRPSDTSTSVAGSFLQQHPAAPTHLVSQKASYRTGIPSVPSRVLDAPQIWNNFYINILDWSSHDRLAVALNSTLYAWNATSEEIAEVLDLDPNGESEIAISSCKWIAGGTCIAVGTSSNEVHLYDPESSKRLRVLKGHTDRVSSLAWNSFLLASGSKSGMIFLSDTRAKDHCVVQIQGHEPQHEICGLVWQDCATPRYLASGSNDNTVQIWSSPMIAGSKSLCSSSDPAWPRAALYKFTEHKAAVKALAFCPWHDNLLATGGGSADCTIKLWNLNSGKLITNACADAPVAGIVWNKQYKELISGHGLKQSFATNCGGGNSENTPPDGGANTGGNVETNNNNNVEYSSSSNEIPIHMKKNPITVWKYPAMDKMRELYGHANRIIGISANPDRSVVATASADETIKFWDIWPNAENSNGSSDTGSQGSKTIRHASDENGMVTSALSKISINRIR